MHTTHADASANASATITGWAVVRDQVGVTIRPASQQDIGAIVVLHQVAFAGFFLTSLGRRFLTAYYRLIASYDERVFLVATQHRAVVGFAAGFMRPARFYRRACVRSLVLPAIWAVVLRPQILIRIVLTAWTVCMRHNRGSGDTSAVCELAAIGVAPGVRRRGVGTGLIHAFRTFASANGATTVRLTTDAVENEPVVTFYETLGFERARTFVAPVRRLMHEYTIDLVALAPTGEEG